MAEYIKREDVIKAIESLQSFLIYSEFVGKRGAMYSAYDIGKAIEMIPSADVVERKRGEWDKDSNMAFYWKCSECGAYLFWRHEEFMVNGNPNFCPNCGVDMRGER